MNVKKTKSSKKIVLKITMSMTLRGPANVGGGYLLDLRIPLSGEEGDVLLGEIARDNQGEMDL